jgi:hypothetical protein
MTDSWGRHGSNIQHGADVSVHVIPTCRARCGTEKQGTGAGRWDLPVGEDVNRERWDEEGKYAKKKFAASTNRTTNLSVPGAVT